MKVKTINNIKELKKSKLNENFILLMEDAHYWGFTTSRKFFCEELLRKYEDEETSRYMLCKAILCFYNLLDNKDKIKVKAYVNAQICMLAFDRLNKIEYKLFYNEKLD